MSVAVSNRLPPCNLTVNTPNNCTCCCPVGDDECRAWAIDKDTPAFEAAGAIHTDLSKGFVRANVMGYADFLAAGYEEKNCKSAGTFRNESKEYVVQDGDIMHILANR